jgi:D-alanyl-D-alanine carboxypeptidase
MVLQHFRAFALHVVIVIKTFTAVAVLRLVEERKLSLDATLKDLLGEAAARIPYADRITVSQLLDHSSGIYATNNDMDYLITVIGRNADPARVWKPEEMIALADKSRSKPSSLPGEGHFYSDTNYILLGMIVERASGRPFKEYLEKTVLEPLGMRSTYFYSDYLGKNAHPPIATVQGYLLPAGFFPTESLAREWLAYVLQPEHPKNSFPRPQDPSFGAPK